MENFNTNLKQKVYGLMTKKDIKDIVFMLANRYGLSDYIEDVEFTMEEFNGVSFEDAINYDQFNNSLIINLPLLHDKFIPIYNKDTYVYNWMILFNEILYAFEDIRLSNINKEKDNTPEKKLITLCKMFETGNDFIRDYPVLYNYARKKTTNAKNLIDPIERLKTVNAHFKTIESFNLEHISSPAILEFVKCFKEELLNGYKIDDQSIYPLKTYFFQNSYLEGQYFMHKMGWYDNEPMMALSNASQEVTDLKERLALGYPIDSIEHKLVRTYKI